MSKFTSALLVLLAAVLIPACAYCLQDIAPVKSISGKVMDVNIEGGVVRVHTEIGDMTFYMTAISDLSRENHHISAVEIKKDDMIVVKYIHGDHKNNIVSLEDKEKSS